jgi:predicted kinase
VAVGNARLESDSLRLLENLEPLPEPAAKPFFIAVSGLPGTGKSHLCHRLARVLPAVLLESDALRKALFPKPTYSSKESEYLFRLIHFLVENLLSRSTPVILDATNLIEKNREFLYAIADRLEVKLILVKVFAPPSVVRQRLRTRLTETLNKSDADWSVYAKMLPTVEAISRRHLTVDTSRDISAAINRIVSEALGKPKRRR